MQFGPRGGASGTGGAGKQGGAMPADAGSESQGSAAPELDTINYPEEDINPDDIPF